MAVTLPPYARMLVDGHQEQADYGTRREPMDGLAKQRPRWSLPIVPRPVRLFVGSVQNRLAMDEFIRDDLRGGAEWFNFRDPVTGLTQRGQFAAGSLQWTQNGGWWFLAAQLISIGGAPVGSDFWALDAWGSPAGNTVWQFDAWGI